MTSLDPMLNEHCSCGVLGESAVPSTFGDVELTQMEVIFKAIAESHQTEDQMPDSCGYSN